MTRQLPPISLQHLAFAFIPVLVVLAILHRWSVGSRRALFAVGRMLLQLLLVGYVLTLVFEPREEKVFKVEYVQRIRKPHAVYIVTTTREWERAIEVAEFEFRIPAELDGVELSFEPDRTESRGDTLVHYMRQEQFYPDEDLTVTWTAAP